MAEKFVWDIVVRITHWVVACAVIANLFFTEPGENVHKIMGFIAIGAVALRLLWSFTLAKMPARLRDLIPTPTNARHHLNELKRGEDSGAVGHNAFGLLAVWAMWGCLAALAFTGYHAANFTDLSETYALDNWHETAANILLALFVLHIAAILFTSWRLKRNLVRPMIHK